MTLLDLSKLLTTIKHWILLFIQMFCISGFTRMVRGPLWVSVTW